MVPDTSPMGENRFDQPHTSVHILLRLLDTRVKYCLPLQELRYCASAFATVEVALEVVHDLAAAISVGDMPQAAVARKEP